MSVNFLIKGEATHATRLTSQSIPNETLLWEVNLRGGIAFKTTP